MAEVLEIQIKDVAPAGGPPPAPTYAPPPPPSGGAGNNVLPPRPLAGAAAPPATTAPASPAAPAAPPALPPKPPGPEAPTGADYLRTASRGAGAEAEAAAGTEAGGLAAGAEAAAGMEAGGLAAGAGPIGAVIAVAMEVKRMASDAIKGAGAFAKNVAGLNGAGALADLNESALKSIPIFGDLLSDASKEVRGFLSAIGDTARRLSQYNGQLAASQAKADVAQIVGDVRRAQMLSSGLSRFTDQTSRISQSGQDLMAKSLAALLPVVNQILEILADGMESLGDSLDPVIEGLADTAAYMGAALELMLTWDLDKTNEDLKNTLDKISDVLKKGAKKDFNPLREILAARIAEPSITAAAANFAPGGQFAPDFGR